MVSGSLIRNLQIAFALALAAEPAYAGVRAVWAATDGDKIEKDDLASPRKPRNAAWDGKRITLAAARNEIVAFQVIVEADARGIASLSAKLPEIRNGAERIAYRAPASDPTDTVGRPIQLFSLHYMNVQPTKAPWIYRAGTPAAPADPAGWKPVQIVPENARAGRGGFPLRVAPNTNQSIWIEIYTGRTRPAGTWTGAVEIAADGQTTALPLTLELFDFDLPDKNSMHAMLYFEAGQNTVYQGRRLDAEFHRFAHRHRVELVHAYDEAAVQANFGRFNGEHFTRAHGYEGPGENTGNVIVPRTFYGPGKEFSSKETAWPKADAWMRFLESRLPHALTFLYLPDEPYPPTYPKVRELAAMLHANPGPGRKLRTFLTHRYVKELDGVADIWCSGTGGFQIDRVKQERARGREYWIYNGERPYAGAIVIDSPATDPRATIWASFKHDIALYFYWHANHWRHNFQKPGNRIQNVWSNPVTFDNRGQPNKPVEDQSWANGDGVLLYPGTDKLHPDEDRGIPGPIASIQLANFRRGLQDHQYLALARACGLDSLVGTALAAVVPRVFSDAGPSAGFSENAGDYEAQRVQLGRALAACKAKTR